MKEFKPILKTNEYGKTLVPIKEVTAKDLTLQLTPKEDVEKVSLTISNAVISILGYNPVRYYSISKNMLIDNISFDTHSYFTKIQKVAIPLEEKFVDRLISCDKHLAKIQHVHKKEGNSSTDEIRMLLIGKMDGEYIPFQLNFKREESIVKGKKKSFLKSSLGIILNGKDYVNCERYDPTPVHQNLFYDGNKHYTDLNQNRYVRGTAHLHYTNKRAFISLFEALQNKGYDAEEILKSQIMGKQEVVPFTSFNNCEEAKNFFFKRYNIKMDFKNFSDKLAKAGEFFEQREEALKKAAQKPAKTTLKDMEKLSPKPQEKEKHRKIFVETASQARQTDKEIDEEVIGEMGTEIFDEDYVIPSLTKNHSPAPKYEKKHSIFHFESAEEARETDKEPLYSGNEKIFETQSIQRIKDAYTGGIRVNMKNYNKKMKHKKQREARNGRDY